MTKYVLIVLLSSTGGWSLNRWEQPAMATAVFDDRAACTAAMTSMKTWEKDRRLDNVTIRAICVPQATAATASEKSAQ